MKKLMILVAGLIIFLLVLTTYTVVSKTTGQFTVGNEPPSIESGSFAVQDSETTWDSTELNTHDITPNFKFKVNDPNPDTLTASICIGTAESLCDVLAKTTIGTYSRGNTVEYTYEGSGLIMTTDDCDLVSCSKNYYIQAFVSDGDNEISQNYVVGFLNSVPNTPSGLTPLETHSQTPKLSWTATDPDDGTKDKWPADTLVYSMLAGDNLGSDNYLSYTGVDAFATITSPIPWGVAGETQARKTVYTQIWSVDNLGIDSGTYYETSFDLVDNLPAFTNVYLSDDAIDVLTDSCVDYLPQHCFLNPLSGSYTSVNLKLKIDDTDGDCAALTHNAKAVLCLVDASGAEICDLTTNVHRTYDLNFDSATETSCEFSVSILSGDTNGLEFFGAPGSYKMYLEANSQAGKSTIPWNQAWEYSALQAMDYTDSVFLGDPASEGGDGIQLDAWNPGISKATMTNKGNKILNLEWDATDASSDDSVCSGHTATCWDLSTVDDLKIDDDNDVENDAGNLISVNIPETPTRAAFAPEGGLQICNIMTCDSGIKETLDTYFHIKPPAGLSSGDYKTTFTLTISA